MIDQALCIYHRNCLDGMTAGWIVKSYYPGTTMVAADYLEKPPTVDKDTVVYIVDFSYSGEELLALCQQAKAVIVIDHHEKPVLALAAFFEQHEKPNNLTLLLDQGHSGAALTWNYFHPDQSAPVLVDLVEDRDLWNFKYPTTAAFCQALMALPMTQESWNWANAQPVSKMVERGEVLLAMLEENIAWVLENAVRMIEWDGHLVPLINVPKYMASEVNNRLTGLHDFVISYFDGPEHRVFRFNCRKGSDLNMNVLASKYGGAGHPTSAGLKVPRDHWLASI